MNLLQNPYMGLGLGLMQQNPAMGLMNMAALNHLTQLGNNVGAMTPRPPQGLPQGQQGPQARGPSLFNNPWTMLGLGLMF